jgi:hypothetical protein
MALTETTVWMGYSTYWRDPAVYGTSPIVDPTVWFTDGGLRRRFMVNARLAEEPSAMPLGLLPRRSSKKTKGNYIVDSLAKNPYIYHTE